jgi:hypothetical protein
MCGTGEAVSTQDWKNKEIPGTEGYGQYLGWVRNHMDPRD